MPLPSLWFFERTFSVDPARFTLSTRLTDAHRSMEAWTSGLVCQRNHDGFFQNRTIDCVDPAFAASASIGADVSEALRGHDGDRDAPSRRKPPLRHDPGNIMLDALRSFRIPNPRA